jgi:CRP/FNR family cyclic AMP-dependent transcriptional regulator
VVGSSALLHARGAGRLDTAWTASHTGAMSALESSPTGTDLLALSADLELVSVEAGHELISQGTTSPPIYVLVEGSIVVERDGNPFANVDHPGALFGEMSTVMGTPATATVRAKAASTLRIATDAHAFLARPGVALAVLRLTATRLDAMTRYLSDVRTQFEHSADHLGMVDGVLESLLQHQAPAVRPGSARDPEG